MLDGSPISHSPLSFEDLIDDSYLGAPVKRKPAETRPGEVIVLEEHVARQTAEPRH